jgi:hypothetical protein
MRPSERRDVRQQLWRIVEASAFPLDHGVAKMGSIPIDDDGGEQDRPCDSAVLPNGIISEPGGGMPRKLHSV